MHALVPLLVLFLVLIILGVVGFVVYSIATDIASKTSQKMEDHHFSVGKDGLKIAVKDMRNEDYVGRTQDVLVKAWNLSTWPAYKSRFWNKQKPEAASSGKSRGSNSSSPALSPRVDARADHRVTDARPSAHRSSSATSASGRDRHTVEHRHSHHTQNGLLAEPRPSVKRTSSGTSIPGAFD